MSNGLTLSGWTQKTTTELIIMLKNNLRFNSHIQKLADKMRIFHEIIAGRFKQRR